MSESETETMDRLTTLETKVCKIEQNSEDILSILNTWNEGRAVIKWLKIASKIALWIGSTVAALTAIYHAIKHFGQS